MVTTLTPEEVRAKYGKMFCKALYTLVDEKHGKARVIETCSARGPAEWDVVNRRRSGGVINVINIEGTTIIMDVTLGEKEIKFGAASAEMGGQGLKACRVEGDEVRTTWYGIAGASVGIGARLPGCDTVLRTEFPDEFKIGGGHTAHVDIFTPKLIRVIIGVDDTDTKEKGAITKEVPKPFWSAKRTNKHLTNRGERVNSIRDGQDKKSDEKSDDDKTESDQKGLPKRHIKTFFNVEELVLFFFCCHFLRHSLLPPLLFQCSS